LVFREQHATRRAFDSRKGQPATMQRPCSRNLHQTIAASPASSGSIICTETIELEEAFIFGIAVRPPSGSIPRRGRARSPSDMGRSLKSHFTTPRSSSRTWIKKPALREGGSALAERRPCHPRTPDPITPCQRGVVAFVSNRSPKRGDFKAEKLCRERLV
jgi:hypothetical protein